MRCDVLAIGTELLLGQIVDTNSSWIGEQLAAVGHRHVRAPQGRRQPRPHGAVPARAARRAPTRSIVCGGLGPTPDDVTREAIAEVMGVELERREELDRAHRARCSAAAAATCRRTTCARPTCPMGGDVDPEPDRHRARAAVRGRRRRRDEGRLRGAGRAVRDAEMVTEHVLPDLLERSGERAVIVSRSLKTWGTSESGLAEMIAERVDQQTNPTIAFLARGIEGIYVRMTAKARDRGRGARAARRRGRASCARSSASSCSRSTTRRWSPRCCALCEARGWTLGVAESLTGGFIGARIANVPGASRTFRGSIASYATEVKRAVLGVTAEQVVSEEAAKQMAEGAQRVLGADVGIAVTGVAGPDERTASRSARSGTASRSRATTTEAVTARLPGRPRAHPPVLHDLAAQPAADAARSRCRERRERGLRAAAFVAVVPPPEVLALDRIGRRFGAPQSTTGLRWTRRDQWHLTLQFLGAVADVDDARRIGRRIGPTDRAVHRRARRWRRVPVGPAGVGAVARRRRRVPRSSARSPARSTRGDRAARVRRRRPSLPPAPHARSRQPGARPARARRAARRPVPRDRRGPSTASCCSRATRAPTARCTPSERRFALARARLTRSAPSGRGTGSASLLSRCASRTSP